MKFSSMIAAVSLSLFGAVPVLAQSGYYSATPQGAIAKTKLVTRSTLWTCADGTCTAARTSERDVVLCELVVQRVGALSSFSVGGTAYGDEALAKCNARAR